MVIGGEGGIRTHVPRLRDKAISSLIFFLSQIFTLSHKNLDI